MVSVNFQNKVGAFSKDQGVLFRSWWSFYFRGRFLFFRRPLFNFLFQSTTFQDQDKDFSISPSSFSTLFDWPLSKNLSDQEKRSRSLSKAQENLAITLFIKNHSPTTTLYHDQAQAPSRIYIFITTFTPHFLHPLPTLIKSLPLTLLQTL